MRLILTILLIGLFKAEAQMVINASAPYRPLVAPFVGLLDDYSGAEVAYSLRKLDKDYTGSAIRVRRSNDNTELNISFTASGDLDTTELKNFVGANNGFVTTWYDQSGNARNATNSNSSQQPRIVNAGTIERVGGKIVIRSAVGQSLVTTLKVGSTIFTTFVSLSRSGTGNDPILFFDSRDYMYLQYGTNLYIGDAIIANVTVNTNQTLITLRRSNTVPISSAYRNNAFVNSTTSVPNNAYFADLTSRTARNGTVFMNELIVYYSDQINNISAINTNINNYWSIY